jgi:Rieske Fe-S protein
MTRTIQNCVIGKLQCPAYTSRYDSCVSAYKVSTTRPLPSYVPSTTRASQFATSLQTDEFVSEVGVGALANPNLGVVS